MKMAMARSNGDGFEVHMEKNAGSRLSVSTVMGDRLILEFRSCTNRTRRKGGQVDVLKAMFKARPGAILDRKNKYNLN